MGVMNLSLKVYVYDRNHLISKLCLWYFKKKGFELVATPQKADVAFAPQFSMNLVKEKKKPKYGTLIFHPSLLPRHRGQDALGWAFRFGEKYTGACWYWYNDQPYTGDICEMVVLGIQKEESLEEFYDRSVVPSALQMLYFITDDLSKGIVRRRPQSPDSSTYEPSLIDDEYDQE